MGKHYRTNHGRLMLGSIPGRLLTNTIPFSSFDRGQLSYFYLGLPIY